MEASIVSLSRDATEYAGNGLADDEVDVRDPELRAQLAADLKDAKIAHADIDDPAAVDRTLEEAFEGVDAVVACVGSRQGSFGVWVAQGAKHIVNTMKKKQVDRLVILSSMGMGTDFIPLNPIRILWSTMLNTVLRKTKADITKMENVVVDSHLSYLLVRPVGLTPEEPPKPREHWKILTDWDGPVNYNIAKKDVGTYMVSEALEPTLVRTAVTLGSKPKKERAE